VAAVVHHDGGGGTVSGGDRLRRWWGVMRGGGCSDRFESRRGGRRPCEASMSTIEGRAGWLG
jgi:hypothetical protein